jgi:hypothetical protein
MADEAAPTAIVARDLPEYTGSVSDGCPTIQSRRRHIPRTNRRSASAKLLPVCRAQQFHVNRDLLVTTACW